MMSHHNQSDVDRLHAASSLLSLGVNCALSPITVETHEPDFNKAIASVIWTRHHHQARSTIFNCGIHNCPLCPATNTCKVEKGVTQQTAQQPTKSRRLTVINWLITSASTTSPDIAARSRAVSYANSLSTRPHMGQSFSRGYPHRVYPAPSSLTSSISSDADGSRSSPNSTSSEPISFDEFHSHHSRMNAPPEEERSSSREHVKTSISDDEPTSFAVSNPSADRKLPFSCQFCPKRFAQSSNRSSHQRIHTRARPFQCPSCPKSFAQRTSLRTHLRTHTGDRPYRCLDCNQRFGDLSTLTKHRRTHTGERPYRCQQEGCSRAFAQSGNLKRHYKTHALDRQLERIAI